jgi:aryl-alcohol dehydrogenase-like predicted oxidoreductase
MAQGMLTGKFASADDVPDGRARTRHFSSDREGVRHGEAGAEDEVFAAITEVKRVAEELGAPMHHVALAWLLKQPAVSCVLAGMRNPEQALDNAKAAELDLPDEVVERLSAVTDDLKAKLGANADMWQGDSRIR